MDATTQRLERQGRQQELLLEIVRRALQRVTAAEADIAAAQSRLAQLDEQLDAQALRMDAFGDALLMLEMLRLRIGGQLGAMELENAAIGGRDDDAR